MDNTLLIAILALVLGPSIGLFGVIYASRKTSKGQSDLNETNRIQIVLDGQSARITSLESEVKELRVRDADREKELAAARLENANMRRIIRAWVRQLQRAWKGDQPMPMPSEKDQQLLGL